VGLWVRHEEARQVRSSRMCNFFVSYGIAHYEFVPKVVLRRLHFDIAATQSALSVQGISGQKWHPPYFQGLAPWDFFSFSHLKLALKRRTFDDLIRIQKQSQVHLSSSKPRTSASVFSSGAKIGLTVSTRTGIT